MRRLFLLILLLLISVSSAIAQENDSANTRVVYYNYLRGSDGIEDTLYPSFYNLCIEAILPLNPHIKNPYDLEVATPIVIPTDEPHCYQQGIGMGKRLRYYEGETRLAEPYYDEVAYVATNLTLEEVSHRLNICPEVILAENYLIRHFGTIRGGFNLTLDVLLPDDPTPCYEVVELSYDMTPNDFDHQYNICYEAFVAFNQGRSTHPARSLHGRFEPIIPPDTLPCYNEEGQRLIFWDETGVALDEPIYSDMQVVIYDGETPLETIAADYDVCFADFVRLNRLTSDLPTGTPLFIPHVRDCDPDLRVHFLDFYIATDYRLWSQNIRISQQLNICLDYLQDMNPAIFTDDQFVPNHYWIVYNESAMPCYTEYHAEFREQIEDIAEHFNVCPEILISNGFYQGMISSENQIIYIPDNQPCYNDVGQRLSYFDEYGNWRGTPIYNNTRIHYLQAGDTLYELSQQYNVCVHDIQRANLQARSSAYRLIPDTRPCYDDTGQMLHYFDDEGYPLAEPIAGELAHYTYSPISYIYNVCSNRIVDANADSRSAYRGTIIPTDRPPCYDENFRPIDYVCYDQLLDFSIDYSTYDEDISFSYDGTHCYRLDDPETRIWYHNQVFLAPSTIGNENYFYTPEYIAWCFGVSTEAIHDANAIDELRSAFSLRLKMIPAPTRGCYLHNPAALDGLNVHYVVEGDTLSSIAAQYGKLTQWVADANDITDPNLIWVGQPIIIPEGITTWELTGLAVAFGSGFLIIAAVFLKQRIRPQRKKKNEEIS